MTHDLDRCLTGISGILVTPCDADGEIAPERLQFILDRALAAGVHIPVVNGNTGAFYALTTDKASNNPVTAREAKRMTFSNVEVFDDNCAQLVR